MARFGPPVLAAAALALTAAADASAARLWFTSGEQFRTVTRTASTPASALRALLRGPSAAERRRNVDTQIPAGTRLAKLVAGSDGAATLAFNQRFMRGVPLAADDRSPSQSATLFARLGQVLYTATQFHSVTTLKITAGGHLVTAGLTRRAYAKPPGGPPAANYDPGKPEAGTKKLQRQLAALGYLPDSAVDGLYGYRTEQAVTAFQAWEGLARDGDAGPLTKARLAKASRPQPVASGPAKRIEVDRAKGVALLIRDNRVSRAIHVSTGGGANATPPGTFKVFRKEERSWSVPFQVWLPYASYFNNGIAFHEYPDVPPYPASHGCVRVPAPEAPVVYAFATIGITVIVR